MNEEVPIPHRGLLEVLGRNLRAIWGRTYVRVVGGNREPSWLIGETVLPLLQVSAYIYVYRHLGGDPAYTGFVLLGGVMTAYWMSVIWSMALQFYWEKEMGNLDLYLMAPISRMAILGGMAVGGIYMTTVRAAAILVLGGVIFGVHLEVVSWPWLLAAMFFCLAGLYGMGMAFSSLFMVFGRGGWKGAELMQEPVYLLSGFYFPLRQLGYAVAAVASFIPIALGLDAVRQFCVPVPGGLQILSPRLEVMVLAAFTVLFVVVARRALSFMEALGKREGRLSLRWQ